MHAKMVVSMDLASKSRIRMFARAAEATVSPLLWASFPETTILTANTKDQLCLLLTFYKCNQIVCFSFTSGIFFYSIQSQSLFSSQWIYLFLFLYISAFKYIKQIWFASYFLVLLQSLNLTLITDFSVPSVALWYCHFAGLIEDMALLISTWTQSAQSWVGGAGLLCFSEVARMHLPHVRKEATVTGPHWRPFVNFLSKLFLVPILSQCDGFLSFCFCLSKWYRTHIFNSVIMLLFQTALPLELPQVKSKRNDEGKGLGMQLRGPLGPGGKGSVSELKSAPVGCPGSLGKASPRPGSSGASQEPTSPLQSAADHLEEELDLLLNLDAPAKAGVNILPDQMPQDLESEKDGKVVAQEEKGTVFILLPNRLLDSVLFWEQPHPWHTRTHLHCCLTSIWRRPLTSISVLTPPLPQTWPFWQHSLTRYAASRAAACLISALNLRLRIKREL